MRQVHQLLAALSYGDAIGNEALAIQRRLRAAGFASEIYAERVHPRMAGLARPLWQYRDVSSPETVCVFHFSIGSAAGRLIHPAPDRLVVVYHNITPAPFFLGFHPHLAGLCYHGRRELACFAERSALGLGDSEYNRRELVDAGFARTGVLPIVMDVDALLARPPAPVVTRLYADDRVTVGFVGRIIPNKAIHDLIRAFAVYQRYFEPRSRLLLVGDHRGHERYHDRLQEMVRELQVDEVVFTGHVDDDELAACYGLMDVFLCLSDHEGYGVPLVEAMAHRIPVIAYDAGAVGETLRGGGLVITEKPPERVAALLDRVGRDPGLRSALVRSGDAAVGRVRAIDFDALLMAHLQPVLGGAPA